MRLCWIHRSLEKISISLNLYWLFKSYPWFIIGRFSFRFWKPSIHIRLDGWKLLKGDRKERMWEFLASNPWYLVGFKKYGKFT